LAGCSRWRWPSRRCASFPRLSGRDEEALRQDTYLNTRSTAIESIESTIAELGSIFQQLAQMVAQQGETVQRIDADTSDIANNVGGAQRELLKYYSNISGNRRVFFGRV
jgi:t-SNARE complex subunit (syntaxin)